MAGGTIIHWPPKARCLEVFMVNNRVFRWPKPSFFMVLGAHGIVYCDSNFLPMIINVYGEKSQTKSSREKLSWIPQKTMRW